MNQKGFTLAEVSIAALILAIGATGVLGVVLQCRYQGRNNQSREEIQFHARKVLEDLQGYVRARDSTAAPPNSVAPNGDWRYCWSLPPGGTCSAPSITVGGFCCTTDWALAAGTVDITSVLPSHLRNPPVGATLSYTVTAPDTFTPPTVSMTMRWSNVE